jgi:hypothetical protein
MGCPLLLLHDQLPLPKERPQEKDNEIHILEPGEISFSTSRPNSSMSNYGQSQKSSSNNQCPNQVKIISVAFNFYQQQLKKGTIGCNPKQERPIPSSSEPEWKCDSNSRIMVEIWELRGDECLDFFMSVQARSPNQE